MEAEWRVVCACARAMVRLRVRVGVYVLGESLGVSWAALGDVKGLDNAVLFPYNTCLPLVTFQSSGEERWTL